MRDLYLDFFLISRLGILLVLFSGISQLMFQPVFGKSGQYLVATQATRNNDFEIASDNYLSILKRGITETIIYQEALLFSVLSDDLEVAQKIANSSDQQGLKLPAAGLISLVTSFKDEEFNRAFNLLVRYDNVLPEYLSILVSGWKEIENGSLTAGIDLFASLSGESRYLGLYNCAIAYAMAGDFQKSLPFLEELEGQKLKFDELQLKAMVEIYSNSNLNYKAIKLIETHDYKQNSYLFKKLLADLKNGKQLKFSAFMTSADALANVFYLMGNTSGDEQNNQIVSNFYIQLAEFLSDQKDYYNLRLAESLLNMRAFSYAIEKFKRVQRESEFYLRAQLGVANSLVRSKEDKLAQKILEKLIEDGFTEFVIFDSLADIFRANEDYQKAIKYYDTALDSIAEEALQTKWSTFFVRGISYDQSGDWEKAKIDLENALEFYPNHPEVLNYFGYSLIERKESLEEALEMIESAVAQKPQSGYIVDSLAWGLFRLGYYEEAIVPMERAIELEPHDPIVNDHLGDVLWMIGRKREAKFQWKRALLFGPTVENEKKIKKKLRYGITDLE